MCDRAESKIDVKYTNTLSCWQMRRRADNNSPEIFARKVRRAEGKRDSYKKFPKRTGCDLSYRYPSTSQR